LANLDQVDIGVAHAAAPFPSVIVPRLGKKERPLAYPEWAIAGILEI
jgi:hypothetical protein